MDVLRFLDLFKNAFSLDPIIENTCMKIMNRMCKELVISYFEVPAHDFIKATKKNHNKICQEIRS